MVLPLPPFDVSSYFNENLHDVANSPSEMLKAVHFLQAQLNLQDLQYQERIRILGLVGSYCRILRDFPLAIAYLQEAVELSEECGDEKSKVANQIRLANVFQWQKNYTVSDRMFKEIVILCENSPILHSYLDFAYQHAGKNLFDQGKYREAAELLHKALQLRLVKNERSLIESTQKALEVTGWRLNLREA